MHPCRPSVPLANRDTSDVAEENIEPLKLTWSLSKRLVDGFQDLGMFFSGFDVPLETENRFGGMIMTVEHGKKHPDEAEFVEVSEISCHVIYFLRESFL